MISKPVCQGLVIGANGSTINNGGCAMDSLYTFDKGTVVSRLNRWGRWKMASGVANGFPSQSAFMRLGGVPPGDAWEGTALDSECVQTNKAVSDLPGDVHKLVLRIEYVDSYKDSSVKAYRFGCSKRQYYNFLETAHKLVANNLNLNLQSVHRNDINMLSCLEVRTA